MSRICFAVGGRIFKSKAAPVESPWMFGGIALKLDGVAERPPPFIRSGWVLVTADARLSLCWKLQSV
jgi:hypothetical protein